jgi:hypothetical protein
MFSQMGLAGMLGPAMTGGPGAGGGQDGGKAADGKRVAATSGTRAANGGEDQGSQDNPRTVVTGVAARIRQLARLRDAGRMTDEEFTEQKNRLLGH